MRSSTRFALLAAIFAVATLGLNRALQPRSAVSHSAARSILLACPSAKHDFGEVWEDQRFTWTLPLTNTSPELVRVLDVRASCTCVSIEPRVFTVPPGATRELKLVLDLARPHDKSDSARRAFTADLAIVTATDSVPIAPEPITIRGTVRPVLDVRPRDPSFGTRSSSIQPPLPTNFTVVSATPLETLTAVCEHPGFTAAVRPSGPDSLTVTVTPMAAVNVGPFEASVRLLPVQPGGKALPERRVRVLGMIAADVSADPPQVTIGGRAVGEAAEEVVSIASLTGRKVAVQKVVAHGDGVTAELTPEGQVRVRLAVEHEGELRGQVEVEARADGDAPVMVVVPVVGYGTAQQGGER